MRRQFWLVILFVCGFIPLSAQDEVQVSPTPLSAILATPTPIVFDQAEPTVTPTFTETPPAPILLEAKESAGEINIRAQPDPNADILGTIRSGNRYGVVGRYFSWFQLIYDTSPTGRAWVFGEIVDIIGEASDIPEVDPFTEPTPFPADIAITETTVAILLTPGGDLTATADTRIIIVPTRSDGSGADTVIIDTEILPTFTAPPNVPLSPPTPMTISNEPTDDFVSDVTDNLDNIPPIAPILIVGGIGIIGLLLNSLRRS